ncbi:nucleotidyltransferase [Methylobacterium sp. GC_Met_2]|uniref:nucleotidyltransferase domain-containing protein n=1 Tax=Methylobacterium sp. GC_Met_2 TaxID=2937376 RepID=UPI00226B3F23|nr:nucleotidyltransferase [Methylobacterium sp. GC_Met_2]
MFPDRTALPLDELLIELATAIELSDHDREIAENRYRRLKVHLERPSSPLSEHLLASGSLIYAQGSMAIGATIVSGTEDDRFDVDALVEMTVPAGWSDDEVLDRLEEALKGFPGMIKIVRCTRCVQLQFAFMHMDVTILDPAAEPRALRVGEIFHSPDEGAAYRVPSNPFGFAGWYRASVGEGTREFQEALRQRRREFAIDRIPNVMVEKAEQENLPSGVPPRLDAQQVVALKLMKRFLNMRYEDRALKRPPSIYLTKISSTCGYDDQGLTAQLERYAATLEEAMAAAEDANAGPDERNPMYREDRLNDRWPQTQADRRALREDMAFLQQALAQARQADLKEISKILAGLFGERISTRTVGRYMDRATGSPVSYQPGTGRIIGRTAMLAPALAKFAVAMPRHNFHASALPTEDDDDQ